MGNIISDSSGSIKSGASDSAFKKNMTDILFELDLLNTGKYDNNKQQSDPNGTLGPRPEYDYQISSHNNLKNNSDVQGSNRHYNSANPNQLVDIIGLPYTDNSYTNASRTSDSLSEKTSYPNDPKKSIQLDSNKFYNLKRGFCNGSNKVPIDIVGFDPAYDDTDANWGTGSNTLKTDQTSNYLYPANNANTAIDNCLTWGSVSPPSGQTSFFTTESNGAKKPIGENTIPDILDPTNRPITTDTLNSLASEKNIYGRTLTPECKSLLAKTLTNSYVAPLMSDYSKFTNLTLGSNSIANLGFQSLTQVDPSTNMPFKIVDYAVTDTSDTKDGKPVFGTYKSATSGTNNRDQNQHCKKFTEDLCDYYYYYDLYDGIIQNNSYKGNNSFSNSIDFVDNFWYLSQHIPDCRCKNLVDDQMPLIRTTLADRPNFMLSAYAEDRCYAKTYYGSETDPNTNTRITNDDSSIRKITNYVDGKKVVGYRRQKDPMALKSASFNDEYFMYVPDGGRVSSISLNRYVCTISQEIKVQGVAGDVIINGIGASCNISGGGGTNPPPNNSPSPTNNLPPSTNVSFIYQKYSDNRNIETNDKPVNPGTKIIVNVRFPDSSNIPNNFLTQNKFALALVSDNTKQIDFPKLVKSQDVCKGNTQSIVGDNVCYPPYELSIPFLYGNTTVLSGIPYQIILQNNPPGTSLPIQGGTVVGAIINMKQYSMRISYVELKRLTVSTQVNYFLHIGVNMNTDDNIVVRAQVILTPVSDSNASSVPPGCTAGVSNTPSSSSSSGKLYQSFTDMRASLINGALLVGSDCKNASSIPASIQPIKYYYSIILNGIQNVSGQDTGGYNMLYDNTMISNEKCIIDFSNLQSSFNSFTLSYIDYDDNDSVILLSNNDSVKYGATLVIEWKFNTVDDTDRNIDLYYDIGTSYNINSPTAVKIQSTSLNGTNSTSLSGLAFLSNSHKFICPIGISSPIVIYGIVKQGNNQQVVSPIITVNPTTGISHFRNWKVLSNAVSISDMAEITLPLTSENTIINYFSLAKPTTPAAVPTYKYIIYNPGSSNIVPKWYGGNSLSNNRSTIYPQATIFENPSSLAPPPEITITGVNDSSTIPANVSIPIGSQIKLTYTLNRLQFRTEIQVMIGSSDTTVKPIIIYTFSVNGSQSSDSVSFSVFYKQNILNPYIYLSSYNTFRSNQINIKIDPPAESSSIRMTNAPAYQVINNNISNQIILINPSTSSDSIINNINLKYTSSFPDNKYYILLNNFQQRLNVLNSNITFNSINLILPVDVLFGSVNSINSFNRFSNVSNKFKKKKKLKELEPFYGNLLNNSLIEHVSNVPGGSTNEIHFDTLQLDFSTATINSIVNIELNFTGYSKIYIHNVQLIFGNNNLDNVKFNLSFTSDSLSPYYQISEITFVGILNTRISLLQIIPGLTNIKYTSPTKDANGKYLLIVPLTYANGYYKLPETYSNQLSDMNRLQNQTPPPGGLKPADDSQLLKGSEDMSWVTIILIIIGVIVLIGILVWVYFKFIRKSSSPNDTSDTSTST